MSHHPLVRRPAAIAAAALLTVVAAGAVVGATRADAAGNCTPIGQRAGKNAYACEVWLPPGGVPVYNHGRVVGHLTHGGRANWFICRTQAGESRDYGYVSRDWAVTMADNNQWGVVPANYAKGADDRWGGLPDCSTLTGDRPAPKPSTRAPKPKPEPSRRAPAPKPAPAGDATCGFPLTGASPTARAMVVEACAQRHLTYAWGGGHGPQPGKSRGQCAPNFGAPNDCNVVGYDCSGLVRQAYFKATGNDGLNGTAQMQKNLSAQRGKLVPTANLVPGDILFFGHGEAHHVGIYLGDGKMINALQSGAPIQVSPVQSDLSGAARY